MNKKIKVLLMLNIISYSFMLVIVYLINNDLFVKFGSRNKFVIGIIPYILTTLTSFILASDRFVEFKHVKIEASIDWILRIVVFGIIINYSSRFPNVTFIFLFIVLTFIISIILEYRINKKVVSIQDELISQAETEVTYEEKCNLKSIVKSINSGMFLIMIFSAVSLSVPINKNMRGTTERWYIPVISSIIIYIYYINQSHKNYLGFFLDKKKGKHLFVRDIVFASIGYMICLVSSFFSLKSEIYSYIFLVGLSFVLPNINTVRKMSIRLKYIKSSLDNETYHYFLTKE